MCGYHGEATKAREKEQGGEYGDFFLSDLPPLVLSKPCICIHIDSYLLMRSCLPLPPSSSEFVEKPTGSSSSSHTLPQILILCPRQFHHSRFPADPTSLTAPRIAQFVLPPFQPSKLSYDSPHQRSTRVLWFIRIEFPPHGSAQSQLIDILRFLNSNGLSVVTDQKTFVSELYISDARMSLVVGLMPWGWWTHLS